MEKYLLAINFCIIILFLSTKNIFIVATFHEVGKILSGTYTNARTIQLLNQLCNDSQEDEISRDACYGCFFRASNKPSGYPMLLSMVACADLYLNDSNYGHCSAYLKNATSNAESKSTPAIIYCTFLECIRQVNKDSLIRSCIEEAQEMVPENPDESIFQAQLFVNTSACILAKTRCSSLNPITGAAQTNNDEITKKLSIANFNAILINSNYDLNIVQLPYAQGVVDECAKYRNIKQATWPGVSCV